MSDLLINQSQFNSILSQSNQIMNNLLPQGFFSLSDVETNKNCNSNNNSSDLKEVDKSKN